MNYKIIKKEEELKNSIANDFFNEFDCTKILGNIDFSIRINQTGEYSEHDSEFLVWAEAKVGIRADIYKSFVQLILTIGKARSFDQYMPPAFLGAFDAEKIAFVPYSAVHDIFYQNDFNWLVTPSDHTTKEFKLVYERVQSVIEAQALLFTFEADAAELSTFIKTNFVAGKADLSKIRIDKNNFTVVYNKWLGEVKPHINMVWEIAKKHGIIDGDFYLADLLSQENITLKEKLYVLLKTNHYVMDRKIDDMGLFNSKTATFSPAGLRAHTQFWNKYERPPKEIYWDYIVERRDLLVPQDVRERKGSFFTPQIWVELSQRYLADTLGVNWQDDYYVWDCAAGTGNLLTGLTNRYNIWASTLDKQDVDVMHDRIETMNRNSLSGNGANLLKDHVFQFDFLNDDFGKLPKVLQDIINDPKKRRKLIVYINPPYAEASNKRTFQKGIEGNRGVEQSLINKKYAQLLGQGNAELFAQFLTRIFFEIQGCKIAQFSKMKILSGQHFIDFRNFFTAKLLKSFVVPANTFDNVKGQFPIGFMFWDTGITDKFSLIEADVFEKNGTEVGKKRFYAYDNSEYLNDWIKPFRAQKNDTSIIGKFPFKGNDFQNQNILQIVHHKMDYNTEAGQFLINETNLLYSCIYFAVRKVIPATWLNDRDQFLFPNDGWKTDTEFQNDCFTYTLFNNNIQSQYGTNHWIPFTEYEVAARDKFESSFMTDFISGKTDVSVVREELFHNPNPTRTEPLVFSAEAKAVFDAARKLWRFFHAQDDCNVNASVYDIREYFQGRNDKGKMNNRSDDQTYTNLIAQLRDTLKLLARKIEPKVYEYGFLKV